MKTRIIITIMLAVTLCFGFGVSAMGEDLQISGFFDVVGNYQTSVADKTSFDLGQAVLSARNQVTDDATASVVVAYNNAEGVFGLRAATFIINLYESKNNTIKSASITAGKFDVPFGIDYNVYASIARKLVSAPLVVGLTHGGWNDLGVQFNMNWKYGNFVAYGVNGFESSYEVSDAAHALTLGLSIGDEVNTTPANADLEVGGSVTFGMNQSDKSEMLMFGGDLQYTIADFYFKGEYIQHSLNRSIQEEKNKGYYFQTLYNMNRFFLTGRYGAFQPDGADWVDRYTIGAGYAIANAIEIRFETTINKDSDNNTNILQLVGGF